MHHALAASGTPDDRSNVRRTQPDADIRPEVPAHSVQHRHDAMWLNATSTCSGLPQHAVASIWRRR
jgi:hypothetical protein